MNRIGLGLALSLVIPLAGCSKSMPRSHAYDAASSGGSGYDRPGAPAGPTAEPGGALAIASDDEAPDAGYDRSIQAGLLTVGSFDDTLNGATFAAFMKELAAWSPELVGYTAPMSIVRVVDAQGDPVAGVAVRLRGDGRQGKRLLSGTDGRVVLMSARDGGDGGAAIGFRIESERQGEWRSVGPGEHTTITLARGDAPAIRALDIALVIDATGSMADELEYLKVELRSIASAVSRSFPGVDQRYAVVVYRDRGDEYVTRRFDFTQQLEQFERQLGRQTADGGGDYPEAMHVALGDAAELSWRSEAGTARLAFVVADAPPHDQDVSATLAATEQLRALGVGIYPVAASGVAAEAEAVMRAAAAASGGQYLFLTDDSGVGDAHAEPHIPCYAVEPLRDAMIRMVHTELSGTRVEADPERAIRLVGHSTGGVCEVLQRAGA